VHKVEGEKLHGQEDGGEDLQRCCSSKGTACDGVASARWLSDQGMVGQWLQRGVPCPGVLLNLFNKGESGRSELPSVVTKAKETKEGGGGLPMAKMVSEGGTGRCRQKVSLK
jgi:hypothetical protein